MSGKFNRRHEVAIRIGGDTWDDIIRSIEAILFSAETEGPGRNSVSGGPGAGWVFVDEVNPSVTHDSYFEEVDAWIEQRKQLYTK